MAQVQSLVGELSLYNPPGAAKKKKESDQMCASGALSFSGSKKSW